MTLSVAEQTWHIQCTNHKIQTKPSVQGNSNIFRVQLTA